MSELQQAPAINNNDNEVDVQPLSSSCEKEANNNNNNNNDNKYKYKLGMAFGLVLVMSGILIRGIPWIFSLTYDDLGYWSIVVGVIWLIALRWIIKTMETSSSIHRSSHFNVEYWNGVYEKDVDDINELVPSTNIPTEVSNIWLQEQKQKEKETEKEKEKKTTSIVRILLSGLSVIGKSLRGNLCRSKQPVSVSVSVSTAQTDVETEAVETTNKSDDTSEKKIRLWIKEGKNIKEMERMMRKARIFVIDFHAQDQTFKAQLEYIRQVITFIIEIAIPGRDEVVLRLSSPGGEVSDYGLASAHLIRLRQANIRLTVCVDMIAASGGYLMAVVADRIIAAPFAFIGSIGVVCSIPNINRLLQKYEVDYLQFTAGIYKRTVDPFTKVTEEGQEKMKQYLCDIHDHFKQHICTYRPQLINTMDVIATGEAWLAIRAKELQLIDELSTSDQYIVNQSKTFDILQLSALDKSSSLSVVSFFKQLFSTSLLFQKIEQAITPSFRFVCNMLFQ